MDARSSQLVQFAQMGSIYMKNITGNPNPRVAIVNVGAEEEKGNALVKETFPLLKACDNINFIGSIEARDITDGYADVIVCDAFVGNVILKMFEGVASTLLHGIKDAIMSSFKSKIGGLLIKDSLKSLLKTYDVASYGGAPMLGLRGLVVKTHGNAEAIEIQNALGQCINFTEQKLTEQFQTGVSLKTRKTAAADNAETRTE
jgi:glycerol-3-phosphate acyltransferase PlsX